MRLKLWKNEEDDPGGTMGYPEVRVLKRGWPRLPMKVLHGRRLREERLRWVLDERRRRHRAVEKYYGEMPRRFRGNPVLNTIQALKKLNTWLIDK